MQLIGRWNSTAAESLPSYMRSCYKALYTVTNEIADPAEKEHGLNHVNHLRKAVCVLLAKNFYLEYTSSI
jgi:(3S)-linalool synthase